MFVDLLRKGKLPHAKPQEMRTNSKIPALSSSVAPSEALQMLLDHNFHKSLAMDHVGWCRNTKWGSTNWKAIDVLPDRLFQMGTSPCLSWWCPGPSHTKHTAYRWVTLVAFKPMSIQASRYFTLKVYKTESHWTTIGLLEGLQYSAEHTIRSQQRER